jgi:alpha-amylase/alpha-mannosidase (GH57 family)
MEKKVTFILGLHNHQPVGNFDHVFEEAYHKAYYPFLNVLSDYPDIPCALHNSGVLWNWLLERHPEYLELLAEMVKRGQIELMSGGYYEPILSIIPERDRRGQLSRMRDFVRDRFGAVPRGCWLTERIWDPHLPRTLADAELEYVVVDDSHFKSTGFESGEMRGFFVTEEDGAYINVFPIDKRLRYLIPFDDPAKAISHLRGIAEGAGHERAIAVLADDGEKFGLWPGTHSLCYEEQWLRRFFDALCKCGDWLEISSFSRVIDECRPLGIVYLPTASYSEMMEWALPLRAQRIYKEAERILASDGGFENAAEIVRGGFWRNFLVKYEESNWMHKRMLLVSSLVEEYLEAAGNDERWKQAADHLYQAQCNCAYWHGLFGGLYLPHLRRAVFSHLIEAEKIIERGMPGTETFPVSSTGDIDGDGVEEVVLTTRSLKAIFKMRGAALREFDITEPALNLTDTLTRREELYHRNIVDRKTSVVGDMAGAVSIHEISAAKEKNLDRYLVYDRYQRSSLLDHFLDLDTDLDTFSRNAYRERGDFLTGIYTLETKQTGGTKLFTFERMGRVDGQGGVIDVTVGKSVRLSAVSPEIEVRYELRPLNAVLKCRFAVESVFSLLAGNAPDRYFSFPDRELSGPHLASTGAEEDVSSFRMVDEWLNIAIRFRFEPAAVLWRFPIETVSNSESGFERVYQGSAIVPVWDVDCAVGAKTDMKIHISMITIR